MKNIILITGLVIGLILILFFVFLKPQTKTNLENNIEQNEKQENINNEKNINNQKKYMNYIITLQTNKGEIKFETYAEESPNTVQNFISLANKGFYNGVIFHRVIDEFMIQGGDPTGTGRGGPGYSFDDEINPNSEIYKNGYLKGVIAMANTGPNTQGSQFFIMVADYPLPPAYTIFGKVIAGQETADAISLVKKDTNDKPIEDVIIEKVLISEKSEN